MGSGEGDGHLDCTPKMRHDEGASYIEWRRTMLVPRQQYPRELKIATMRELDSGKSVAEVARTYQVSPKRLETWRGEWRAEASNGRFPGRVPKPKGNWMSSESPSSNAKLDNRRSRS